MNCLSYTKYIHSIFQIQVSWQVQGIIEIDFQKLKWHTPKQGFPMCGLQTIGFLLTGLSPCQSCSHGTYLGNHRGKVRNIHFAQTRCSWFLKPALLIVYVWTVTASDSALSMTSRIIVSSARNTSTHLMSSVYFVKPWCALELHSTVTTPKCSGYNFTGFWSDQGSCGFGSPRFWLSIIWKVFLMLFSALLRPAKEQKGFLPFMYKCQPKFAKGSCILEDILLVSTSG